MFWGARLLAALMFSGLLEASAQQPPEILDLSTSYITLSNGSNHAADLTILKGELTDQYLSHESTAVMGTVERGADAITFRPLVPFNQDRPYTAICEGQLLHFTVARSQEYEAIQVIDIYPADREVPANILKWYVRFSRPVNPVKIYDHIHFLDEEGAAIDRSILNLKAPLLSDDGTLLTIWIEPGRQKRLLGPNHHLGSVFDPYKSYILHIDGDIKDMEGIDMGREVRHTFITTDTDRVKPSIEDWRASDIVAHTSEPLEIVLPEPIDYGSLIDAFGVYNQGRRVAGTLDYDSEAAMISFRPDSKWNAGSYTIRIEHQLEDLAGNNLRHLFDRPIKHANTDENTLESYTIQVISK